MPMYDSENPFNGVQEYEEKYPDIFDYSTATKTRQATPPPMPDKLQGIIDSPTLKNVIKQQPAETQLSREALKKLNQALTKVRWPFKRSKAKKLIAQSATMTEADLVKILKEYKISQKLTAAKLANQFGPRIKKTAGMASQSRGLSFLRKKEKAEKQTTQHIHTKAAELPPLPPRPKKQATPKIR